MEELNPRVNELVDKLETELESIHQQATKAAELPEEIKGLKDQAKEACRELSTAATSMREVTGKFDAIMKVLTEALEVLKSADPKEVVKEVRDETQKAIKDMESRLTEAIKAQTKAINRATIVVGLLLIGAVVAGTLVITEEWNTGDTERMAGATAPAAKLAVDAGNKNRKTTR